ncbi:MAG: hypothetical protein ABIG39_03765 [Candidatus Micrarchaeota archaeon]
MKAQISSPILASMSIATILLLVVSIYAITQRLGIDADLSPVPLALRHIKADIDSDYYQLFCDAGLCVSSTHATDAVLTFNLNHHSGFFGNLTNFTGSYSSFFNSTRSDFLTSDLSSQLQSNYLILQDNPTDSNYSVSGEENLTLNFNSSTVTAYSLYYACANTTNITWNQDIGDNQDIDLNFSLPGYDQIPINNTAINSKASADGGISYNGARYLVSPLGQTSSLGFDNSGPADMEHRTYLSFNTDYLPDDAVVLSADVFTYVQTTVVSPGVNPEWRVDYMMGRDVIGGSLTDLAWGNKGFVFVGAHDYKGIIEWKNFSIPSDYLDDISVDGQTDFELIPRWDGVVGPNERAYMLIRQTEHILNAYHPYMMVRYSFSGQCSLNRSENYSTTFNTTCGTVNVSFIEGNIYSNFSYMNMSLNATIPTNDTLGLFPLSNRTAVNAPNNGFSDICASGEEPTYPSGITEQKYGSFTLSGQTINMIIANRSDEYNTIYFDTNGNCNFTDSNDEYFVTTGEWIRLGDSPALIDSIAPDGTGAIIYFASAGTESTLLRTRLIQPIYLNR